MNVKNANFVFGLDGSIEYAIVEYNDGFKEKVTDSARIKQISEQLNQKNRQILMEQKIG